MMTCYDFFFYSVDILGQASSVWIENGYIKTCFIMTGFKNNE